MIKNSNQKDKNNNFESEQNLIDFFDLLLKIDKRNNPHLYELENNNDYD